MAARRLEFRILGPLSVRVDGAAVPVGGPKQRALLALLLLSANRVVSRERLIGELFAEQSVNSADHALRNHVSRLRKVLGAGGRRTSRVSSRARPATCCASSPASSTSSASSGSSRTGGKRSRPATGRCRRRLCARRRPCGTDGRSPISSSSRSRVSRSERLEELRLAAVEERIDAELALGRQLALVPELEALVAEHPYRERFRAQLMLALYRSGRQAEGLDVYRQTRTLLRRRARARAGRRAPGARAGDPRAGPGAERPRDDGARATRPHRFETSARSRGSRRSSRRTRSSSSAASGSSTSSSARLADAPLLAIVGPSGSGKSSLLRAGLLPALGQRRRRSFAPVSGRWPSSSATLERVPPGERLVIAVDQFEELFAPSVGEDERRAFVDALVEAAWDPERRAVVLLALRADFFGHLASYVELADLVGPNHVLLGPMSAAELRRAIEGPAERVGLEVEPALVDALVDDVAGETGGLPLLSTALLDLWRERDGPIADARRLRADGRRPRRRRPARRGGVPVA